MAQWSVSWLLLFPLYLLLAGQVSGEEVVAGILIAAVAASSGVLVSRFGGRFAFRFRLGWIRLVPQVAGQLATDLFRVGRVLVAALAGRPQSAGIVRQPFEPGDPTPVHAARRGLVELGVSFAPNGLALGIAPGTLLVHRLAPQPIAADREWPL